MLKKLSESLPYQSSLSNFSPQRSSHSSSWKGSSSPAHELFDFLDLIENWEKIIGNKLAKVTIPLKNQGRTLTILTNHSAYSQALSYREETLRQKLYKAFPSLRGKIKKIRFIVNTTHFERQKEDLEKRVHRGKKDIAQKKKQQQLHPQNPLYKKLKREAEREFQDLAGDEKLKEQMISLYIQNEFKKF